jgi:DNA polymerase-1
MPPEQMGIYACCDVWGTRKLAHYIEEHRPPEVKGIWETEVDLAAVLYDMEVDGLLVDPQQCRVEHLRSMKRMIAAADEIRELADREFTNHPDCIHDILCVQRGLPVLKWQMETDEDGNKVPSTDRYSFDKEALAMYGVHPMVTADPELQKLVHAILRYRTESTFDGLYCQTFIDLHDEDNCIHPSYNAIVRTGRMSSRRPNSQQQNKRSKALILCPDGYAFWSCDYSQIEYRLIVHYIQDSGAIQAYRDDPRTDFHAWVASMLGVKRKAGKTLNFGMAYGAGKKRVKAGLITNPDIIEEIGHKVNEMVDAGEIPAAHRSLFFNQLCEQRADSVYEEYHERLPGIKSTSRLAARVCKRRGYVFNEYGRRRHLPEKASHKAFNSVIQGCAMDIMKERMIAISPRYNPKTREMGIRLAGNVHDELFGLLPVEHMNDPEYHDYICETLETPSIEFEVPIMTGLGVSDRNWAEAAGDETRFSDGEVCEAKDYQGMGEPVAGNLR